MQRILQRRRLLIFPGGTDTTGGEEANSRILGFGHSVAIMLSGQVSAFVEANPSEELDPRRRAIPTFTQMCNALSL